MAWVMLAAALFGGFACGRALWPDARRWTQDDWIRLALAPLLGAGLAGSIFFLLRVLLQLPPAAAVAALPLAVALFVALAWWRGANLEKPPASVMPPAPRWLWAIFGIAAALSVASFLMLAAAAPHGEWDAWSIWNLRARFLFRAQDLSSAFSAQLAWSHPDYPLLLPSANALLWQAGGSESLGASGALALFLSIGAIAAPLAVLWRLRGPALALTGAIAIMSASSLVRVGASLYADVPLAAFAVAACAILVYGLEYDSGPGPFLLAGLLTAFTALTKNEGLLFFIAITGGWLAAMRSFRRFPWFAAGAALLLGGALYFKLRIAPPNDLINAAATVSLQARLMQPGRYWDTFWGFVAESLTFGNILLPPLVIFGIWLALVRFRHPLGGASLLPLYAVAVQIVGYFLVYVGASNDLDWQINTSMSRLLLHLWPLFVFGIFLVSGSLEVPSARPVKSKSR